ncbi:MAG: NapC/NirT family cytochrome c [Rhodocyclaceae bacterium]|nr:NapC/NirT family cytochrome c [Rhodocyclaceae bacterium]
MSDNKSGFLAALRRPSAKYSLLTLLVVGFFSGVFFWGGFNTAMEATNTMPFCISCHEMHDNVYQEYKQTIHYANRTGVRAVCSDCHVPKDWTHKMIRKIQASKEVYGKIMGTINTPEKFEENRLRLATNEWARMKASDSRECRNCHSFEGMDAEKQKARASKMHKIAQDDKKTCIDCHKGIAHKKPKNMPEEDDE